MNYFKKQAKSLDQAWGSLANCNVDSTISATIGNYHKKEGGKYWNSMRWMVDTTFYPIDGEGHCRQAYESDPNEDFEKGWEIPLFIMTLIPCIPIAVILWSNYLINKLW